jgi:hypothetical protein
MVSINKLGMALINCKHLYHLHEGTFFQISILDSNELSIFIDNWVLSITPQKIIKLKYVNIRLHPKLI